MAVARHMTTWGKVPSVSRPCMLQRTVRGGQVYEHCAMYLIQPELLQPLGKGFNAGVNRSECPWLLARSDCSLLLLVQHGSRAGSELVLALSIAQWRVFYRLQFASKGCKRSCNIMGRERECV